VFSNHISVIKKDVHAMPYHYWDQLTAYDFDAFDPAQTIVILPVGSVEQHGAHLPLCVDYRLVEGVLGAMLEQFSSQQNQQTLLILPTLPIGKANEHTDFRGTLSLSVNSLIGLWTDVMESVIRSGFRKIMILNGHGGQMNIMDIVARDVRVRHNAFVVPVNWWSVRDPKDCDHFPADEYRYGIHGGAEETAMMQALHPEWVRADKIDNFIPIPFEKRDQFPLLYGQGSIRHAWKARDLHPSGAIGDATLATPEIGQKIIDNAAASILMLLQEMFRFP
jgi:creatinine amidohydrolase